MNFFDTLVERVENGELFNINFEKRTAKVGKEYLIKDGKLKDGLNLAFENVWNTNTMFSVIENLYNQYKYSLPSERHDKKRKHYFKALPIDEIPDKHLFNPINREPAQARLEGFILCMILNGSFVWDEEKFGSWFWQSKNDPDLVILRSWIENK